MRTFFRAILAALLALAAARAAVAQVDPRDLLGEARAGLPFAQQSGYSTQVLGRYLKAAQIPESGIHGSRLENGETLRFGKVPDPQDPERKVLAFQLAPDDPPTAGSKRSEIAFAHNIEQEKVYWVAFSVYVYDWGELPRTDNSLFGTQIHSGDDSRGLSPSFTIGSIRARTFVISVQYSTDPDPTQHTTVSRKLAETPIAFGRWMDFVFKFRQSQSRDGFLTAWLDGRQILDYRGPLGYRTPGFKDYAKFGYYNWSRFDAPRKVLLRRPVLVLDPTGRRYREADLRSFCCRFPG